MQGRDANRLLQRVIKAEEKKKKLPKAIVKLQGMLDEWQSSKGERFVMGRVDYRSEVLDVVETELRTMAEVKPKKVCSCDVLPCHSVVYRTAMLSSFEIDCQCVVACSASGQKKGCHRQAPPRCGSKADQSARIAGSGSYGTSA